MTAFYLPTSDAGKMQWFNNFANKLPNYRETLQLPDDVLGDVQKGAENFGFMIGNIEGSREYTKQITAYKNIMRNGSKNNAPLGAMPPAPPTLKLPQPPVADIFGQAQKLVQVIKNHKAYNEAIGKDLGIIGEASAKAPHEMKPQLQVEMQAGRPNIKWKKAGMQGIHIYVDRGDGKGYSFLATDTQPDYLDTYPLPTSGQSAIWKYKAIYIDHDEEQGQMSDELSVTVSGKL
jgi:hypothetical protein